MKLGKVLKFGLSALLMVGVFFGFTHFADVFMQHLPDVISFEEYRLLFSFLPIIICFFPLFEKKKPKVDLREYTDFEIEVNLGTQHLFTVPMTKSAFTVGRNNGCDITLKYPSIPPKYFKIVFKKRALSMIEIRALCDTPIHVNRQRVQRVRRIQTGDVIQLGKIKMRVLEKSV